jgi:hypothetical protein
MQSACTVLSSVACPVVQYVSTLSHKQNDLRKKKNYGTWNVFRLSVQILSEMYLTLSIIQRDIIINVLISLCKVLVILTRFNESRLLSIELTHNQVSNYMKSVHWEPNCTVPWGRRDGRTDRHYEARRRFINFANAPNKTTFLLQSYIWFCQKQQLIYVHILWLVLQTECRLMNCYRRFESS